MVESANLSSILQKMFKIEKYRVAMATLERERAFSVGHLRILHVSNIFNVYSE
jgi:hypothetical protein